MPASDQGLDLHAVDPDRDPAGGDEAGCLRHEPPYRPCVADFEAMPTALGHGAIGKAFQSSEPCRFLDLELNHPPRASRSNIVANLDADAVLTPAANGDWFNLLGGKLQNLSHQILLHCAKRFDGLVGAREPHAETRALRKSAGAGQRQPVNQAVQLSRLAPQAVLAARARSDPDAAKLMSCPQRFKASGRE
ncbi:hypothetical protein [Bradyrhizobium japonicum]|uniref:hypothetical protein n=1 Tax=Bradyrhizobium japonicum TaxID=375 RepID=UPI001E2AF4F5|nr:hypothetical protein [Bradyrhizobium japonicum]MCD9824075.1 hypothetical protein [Bradyrhizobium japonicum]MCD9896629.1 hypothetical protein [Bradyrhizobium japonicum]MEB2671121.1 hypothetical protein [Bradyrhizobium japonicum]WLB28637.1 hypothetical protein QIH85_43890 [Bradyrhizobium japonicum]WRI90444.1 hypothetical protein R3F75_05655 [Bradyrhizobium japonicum]